MRMPSIVIKVGAAATILLIIDSACAFMIGLNGSLPNGADAIYAVSANGREVKIAQVGDTGPGGVVLTDLGLPSVTADGNVLFGASTTWNGQLRWSIFVFKANSGSVVQLRIPYCPKCHSNLEMVTDPRPKSSNDGGIVFAAHESNGDDAVFYLSRGKLSRILRTGTRLADGREIRAISYGSVRPDSHGRVALLGYLKPGGQAEILVSDSGEVKILARAGERTPAGGHFRTFGLPAIGIADDELLVAFTARTDRGTGLFAFAQGKLREVISRRASCEPGQMDYLSDESPGLDPRGDMAIGGACAGTVGLYLIHHEATRLVFSVKRRPGYGAPIDYLGAPLVTEPGHIVFGVSTSAGSTGLFDFFRGKINELIPTEESEESVMALSDVKRHTIEVTSISINQHGQIAYLGSP